MRVLFADTNYYVALLNRHDNLHEKARQVSSEYGIARIVTSEFVLVEVFRLLAKHGPELRRVAVQLADDLSANPNCLVVRASRVLFLKAKEMYAEYSDKEWDLVDCTSFAVMQEHGISDALTHDNHFVQMGFRALLRSD